MPENIGKVVQVIGPVVDVQFDQEHMPRLLNAVEIDQNGQTLIAEVLQHVGDDVVRCIAMSSTDGLQRGASVKDTGGPITVNRYLLKRPWAGFSTCWASLWTTSLPRRM